MEKLRLTYGSKKMNEYEEQVIRNMVRGFYDSFEGRPSAWCKMRRSDGGECLVATWDLPCGYLPDDEDEKVIERISEGFEWMDFDTLYTRTEMALLSIGFDYRWGHDDVRTMASYYDAGVIEKQQSFKDAYRIFGKV